MKNRRSHFKAIEAHKERLQTYPLDHLLEDSGFFLDVPPALRQALEEKKCGVQHPQLGNLRYEYFYHWIGVQTVGDYELRIDISGTSDGPDLVFTEEVAFALNNFAVIWNDALSLIKESRDQFNIANPDEFTPTGIICLGRKDKKLGFELTLSRARDETYYWWIDFQNRKAEALNFSDRPITVSRVEWSQL